MEGDQHPERVALRRATEATLERLSESFARDELSLEDFERRVDRVYACTERAELQALVSDLTQSSAVPVAATHLAVSAPPERDATVAMAVFGNVERRASGGLPPGARVLSVFGNVELDLRDVQLPPGVTELRIRAVFGNVEVTVPPTVAVECRGAPIFGSFASLERTARDPEVASTLRIVGAAIFGNVEVKTLPRRQLIEAWKRGGEP